MSQNRGSGGWRINMLYDSQCPLCMPEVIFSRSRIPTEKSSLRTLDLTSCRNGDVSYERGMEEDPRRYAHWRLSWAWRSQEGLPGRWPRLGLGLQLPAGLESSRSFMTLRRDGEWKIRTTGTGANISRKETNIKKFNENSQTSLQWWWLQG